jgi:hypothetical protein
LAAVKRQQLFGSTLAAQRPEASAAASGKDHGMKVYFRQRRSLKISDFRLQIETFGQSEI